MIVKTTSRNRWNVRTIALIPSCLFILSPGQTVAAARLVEAITERVQDMDDAHLHDLRGMLNRRVWAYYTPRILGIHEEGGKRKHELAGPRPA